MSVGEWLAVWFTALLTIVALFVMWLVAMCVREAIRRNRNDQPLLSDWDTRELTSEDELSD